MRTSIVIHQRDVLCVVRHIWLHDGLMDLVNVPLCIHVAIDKHQICFTPDTYATPGHDPSTTTLDTWLDATRTKSFTLSPPYTLSAIISEPQSTTLICE